MQKMWGYWTWKCSHFDKRKGLKPQAAHLRPTFVLSFLVSLDKYLSRISYLLTCILLILKKGTKFYFITIVCNKVLFFFSFFLFFFKNHLLPEVSWTPCQGPEGTAWPAQDSPHTAQGPGPHASPPGPSAPAPAMPQKGWSPAPCSPALPSRGPHWACTLAWLQHMPISRKVPKAWGWGCPSACSCLHLAGAMGRALSARLLRSKWLLSREPSVLAEPWHSTAQLYRGHENKIPNILLSCLETLNYNHRF